jgi:signal transduction histidine kinase
MIVRAAPSSSRTTQATACVKYFHVVKIRPLARRYALDALIVLGALGAVLEIALNRDADDAPTSSLWISVPVVLALTLPLLVRRRFPFALPVGMLVFAGAISFADGYLVPFSFFAFLAILTICFGLGTLPDRRQAFSGLAVALALGLIVVNNDPHKTLGDWIFIPTVFSLVWLGGFALSRKLEQVAAAEERALRVESERADEARRAVAEERQRIARELHDVVAHSVSVMTVQAGGVRRLLRPEQERERAALEQIEQTGREALAEMRRLLGILRQPTDQPALGPQPGMGSLGALIQQMREAGLPVEYRIKGDPRPLPPGIDLSAYRIVQEALTNALKYAGPARAEVLVSYGSEVLQLEILNEGGSDENGAGGSGHGLVGMRERVALYGGKFESGPRRGGGFAVRALLPVRGPQA